LEVTVLLVSDKTLRARIVAMDSEGALDWWREKAWNRIGDKIVIAPFNEDALESCNYNLSVGSEYLSLRKHEDPQPLEEGQSIVLDPGETVLLLTKEYVALPRNTGALVVPRARFIQQGLTLQATRVDPTWHGKLLIGLTNVSKDRRKILRGTPICTMMFLDVDGDVDRTLTSRHTRDLGREHIKIPPEYVVSWRPVDKDAIGPTDVAGLVDEWGPPFDVVRGGLEWTFKRTREYIEQTWAPQALKQMQDRAVKEAYRFTKWVTAALIVAIFLMAVNVLLILVRGP
jgi:deoxycytidine triphosphate deaminase